MGRESQAQCRWAGQTGVATVILESTEIILRGDLRARIPRGSVRGFRADGDDLMIDTDAGPLSATLGARQAASWVAALAKPLPTLAQKLGVDAARPVFVLGAVTDTVLTEALHGGTVTEVGKAAQVLTLIGDGPGLEAALALAAAHPALPVWCIYPKGRAADPGDAAIRTAFRAAGRMDTKACAVSDGLTATRYTTAGTAKTAR